MDTKGSYWGRYTISRRTALRGLVAAGGLAALSLAGCGSDDSSSPDEESGSGASSSGEAKPGGRLIIQPTGYATTLVLVTSRNNTTAGLAGFTHSGLLQLKNGRPIVPGTDVTVEPDLAVAMPEQADPLTYVFKLNPAAKFHSGRPVTSEDVKYSLERYAKDPGSAYVSTWTWLDRVEAPDAQTVVVKTTAPYADAIGSLCGYQEGSSWLRSTRRAPRRKRS